MFTPSELDSLRTRFSAIDSNHDGIIAAEDLEDAIRQLDFPNVPVETIETLIAGSSDVMRSGTVDLTEFCASRLVCLDRCSSR